MLILVKKPISRNPGAMNLSTSALGWHDSLSTRMSLVCRGWKGRCQLSYPCTLLTSGVSCHQITIDLYEYRSCLFNVYANDSCKRDLKRAVFPGTGCWEGPMILTPAGEGVSSWQLPLTFRLWRFQTFILWFFHQSSTLTHPLIRTYQNYNKLIMNIYYTVKRYTGNSVLWIFGLYY